MWAQSTDLAARFSHSLAMLYFNLTSRRAQPYSTHLTSSCQHISHIRWSTSNKRRSRERRYGIARVPQMSATGLLAKRGAKYYFHHEDWYHLRPDGHIHLPITIIGYSTPSSPCVSYCIGTAGEQASTASRYQQTSNLLTRPNTGIAVPLREQHALAFRLMRNAF